MRAFPIQGNHDGTHYIGLHRCCYLPNVASSAMSDSASSQTDASSNATGRSWRRWIVLGVAGILLVFIMQEVLDPWGDDEYLEVPHGDHVHYVPQDRDPDVPLTEFPTYRPGPDERITPDGRVVPE